MSQNDLPRNISAVIALPHARLPDPARIAERVDPEIGLMSLPPPAQTDMSLILPVRGDELWIWFLDAPYPKAEWEGYAEAAWHWPEAAAAYDDHTAHLFVASRWRGETRLDAHLKHTEVVAAITEDLGGVAVMWASVISSPDVVATAVEQYREDGTIPSYLWVLFQMTKTGPKETVLSTLGMDRFGLMEIEMNPAPLEPIRAFTTAEGLVDYLLVHGAVIGDGDTIGRDVNERIIVRHAPSFRDGPGTVYLVDFGAPPDPEPSGASRWLNKMLGRD